MKRSTGRLKAAFDGLGRALAEEHRAAGAGLPSEVGAAVDWQLSSVQCVSGSRTCAAKHRSPCPTSRRSPCCRFSNMSGDPEQEYFTDGITEDIITELSRFRSLFVIARNSSILLQGQVARRPAGRPRTRRPLRAGRQHSQGGESNSGDRPAHRHAERQPHLGGALRPRAGGYLRGPGRADAKHRARHRAVQFPKPRSRKRGGGVPTA